MSDQDKTNPMLSRKSMPFDVVSRPAHYNKHPSGIEAIELLDYLPFSLGNGLKYCWRAGEKDATLQDLGKSAWYFERHLSGPVRHAPDLEGNFWALTERVMQHELEHSLLFDVLRYVRTNDVRMALHRVNVEMARLRAAEAPEDT